MPDASTGRTVLVVDDEEDLREVIRRILTRRGFDALLSGDSEEAVGVCRDYDGGIDLLLTDLGMPGASGGELAEQAVAIRPGLAVLYISGLPKEVAVGQGLIGEDASLIQKPFTADRLVAAVREALHEPA
jgi:DNA-binding NtrC family response regulator